MKKKFFSVVLAVCLCVSFVGCSTPQTDEQSETQQPEQAVETASSAGVCFFSYADTYTANVRKSLENVADANGGIEINSADNQGDPTIQTNNVSNFLTQDVDYLALTNMLPNITTDIAKQVTDTGKTMIFFGCGSPSEQDFATYENLWHVSSSSTESGTIMGDAVAEYWNAHPEADRNGNGTLDYIMLLGVQGSEDSENRATYSVKAVEDAGIAVNNLSGDLICDFSRAIAQEKVTALIANYGDDIDAIFAVNDDMALGAIQALKGAGYFTDESNYIMVTGVDATEVGVEAVEEGTLLVTSLNNPVQMGKSLYKLMDMLSAGEEVTTESLGVDGAIVEGHKIILDYTKITKDNIADAKYDINDTEV